MIGAEVGGSCPDLPARRPAGDPSDFAALFCAAAGLTSIFAPTAWFQSVGPVKPFFDGPATPQGLAAAQFSGGLLMFMAFVLFVVRWNVVNGKAAALGCTVAAINSASIAWTMDGSAFVPRGWYVFSGAFLLFALHLAFNANPMLTAAMLLEKEKAKAAKSK